MTTPISLAVLAGGIVLLIFGIEVKDIRQRGNPSFRSWRFAHRSGVGDAVRF